MPQFTQWNVPDPFPNILYNPAAVDAAIARTQSELGTLALAQRKLDMQQSAGDSLLQSLGGNGTSGTGTSATPADSTPFEQKMGLSEGGRSATKVNDQGYAGQYQFGASRLADLGLYTPAPGEDIKKNEWKGQFKIAPYGVANLQEFLGSPAAQHAAFVAHVANIDKAIAATPGADKFDVNGLRAVAHLGGVGGMQAFIASGGNLNRADSNGTSLKAYYQKFADGGAPALQQAFGSVHGPGGPPGSTPAVRPGGNVSTAWADPNAPLPVPPIPPAGGAPPIFNPNTGPRVAGASPAGAPGVVPAVAPGALPPAAAAGTDDPNAKVSYPPVVTGQADVPVVAPSPVALRTGGTDVAGPGAGQATVPSDAQPNRLAYGTDLPGVTVGLPGNGMAPPPPTAAAPTVTAATPPAPTSAAPARPPVVAPPPAPSRVIPLEPVLPNGLTSSQVRLAASMVKGGAPIADVAAHLEQWKQANRTGQQQAATQAAMDAQAQFERQKYYVEQQQKAEQTAYSRQQDTERSLREAEQLRLSQEGGTRDTARLDIERKKFEQGPDAQSRDAHTLKTADPSSQDYAEAWAHKKWTIAPNGNVIENDVSQYPAPTRSIQRPSFLPAPTPQALDEVRKADTDAKVITSAIDHYGDVFTAAGGGSWDSYIANPRDPKTQQLLGAFDRLKTVLRSPVYYNTGVLQPAEMELLKSDLVSPQTLRGVFATPEALATRMGEIKLAILTRQDAELRSIGKEGVIVRDAADFAKVPAGGKYYDENGHLRLKPEQR